MFFCVNFIEFCLFFVPDLAIFRCFFAAKTAVFILREQLRDYQNAQHQSAKCDSVPAEYGETVLLHETHQQLDTQHRSGERHQKSRQKVNIFVARKAKSVFYNFQKACAKDDGDTQKEGKFRACGT